MMEEEEEEEARRPSDPITLRYLELIKPVYRLEKPHWYGTLGVMWMVNAALVSTRTGGGASSVKQYHTQKGQFICPFSLCGGM